MKNKWVSKTSSQFLWFLPSALPFKRPPFIFLYFLTNDRLSVWPFKVYYGVSEVSNSRTVRVISMIPSLKWAFISQELHDDSPSILPGFLSSPVTPGLSSPVPVQGSWLGGERLRKPLAITSLASHLFLFGTYLLSYMYCVIEADFSVAVKLYHSILNLLNTMPTDTALGATYSVLLKSNLLLKLWWP